MLELWLLGPWKAHLDGAPLSLLPTRHARALLARLALAHPAPVRRTQLHADLFPDMAPTAAAHNLRTTLYYVRQALRHHVHTETDLIGLDPALTIAHDVGRFERASTAEATPATLWEAVELYRGPFLQPAIEGWATAEALRLADLHRDMLRRLVVLAEAQGDLQTVADAARRWVAEEPWDFLAHRALIEALLAQSDRAGSERAIAAARARLQSTWSEASGGVFDAWARAAARLPVVVPSVRSLEPARFGEVIDTGDLQAELKGHNRDAGEWSTVLTEALAAGEQALEESRLRDVARTLAVADHAAGAFPLDRYDPRRWSLLLLRTGYHAAAGPRTAWLADLQELHDFASRSGRVEWRLVALIIRAQAMRVQGQLRVAEELARQAAELAHATGRVYEEARAQRILAFVLDQQIRPVAEVLRAWRSAADAIAATPGDPLHVEARMNIAFAQIRMGEAHAAKSSIDALLADPAVEAHPRLRALAPRYLGLIQYGLRDYEAGVATMRVSVRRLQQIGGQYAEIVSRRWLVDMLAGLGQLETAQALGETNVVQARRLGVQRVVWEGLWTLSAVALWMGDNAEAWRLAQDSLSLAEAHGTAGNMIKVLGIVVQSAAATGRLAEAHAALLRIEKMAGDTDPNLVYRAVPAGVLLLLGERERAARLAQDILAAHDVMLGAPLDHVPIAALQSFWNGAAVFAAIAGHARSRPFQEQAYTRFVDDIARLQAPAARQAFVAATPANRALAEFNSAGPRRLALLPLRNAPTGRPLYPDELAPVVWTVHMPDDPAQSIARRHTQLRRLVEEAAAQGAVATVETLAVALRAGTRTVQRDLQALRQAGIVLQTRGNVREP